LSEDNHDSIVFQIYSSDRAGSSTVPNNSVTKELEAEPVSACTGLFFVELGNYFCWY